MKKEILIQLMLASFLLVRPGHAQDIELVGVNHPDLSTMVQVVQLTLGPAIDYFESQKADFSGPDLGQLYGRLGLHYHANIMTAQATACYTNANALNPINFRWPYLLAMQYEIQGNIDAAIEHYELSLRLNPGNLAAYNRLGIQYLQAKRVDDAANIFYRVLDVTPGDETALAGMGRVELSRGNTDIALSYFQRALEGQPQAGALRFQIAAIYKDRGEDDKAVEIAAQANQQVPRINDPVYAFMLAHRFPSSKFVKDGTELAEKNNLDAATKLFDLATAINPGDAVAFQKLAQTQRRKGMNREAMANLDKVLSLEPFNAFVNYLKANWLEQGGNDQLAIGYYRSAVNADETFIGARMLLANALMRTGGYDEAAKYYQMVIDAQQENPDPYYMLGIANIARDRCADSVSPLQKAGELNVQDPKPFMVLSRVWSTCAVATDEQKATALDYATRLYNQFGNMLMTSTLAMAEAANGRYEEAEAYQAQAMFEAIKAGNEQAKEEMFGDMQRYREQKPAVRSWPPGAAIFSPPRLVAPAPKSNAAAPKSDAAAPAGDAG